MGRACLYLCALLVCLGLFAGCKAKKEIVASLPDLYGKWGVVELNGERLDPSVTRQELEFDVLRKGLSGSAGCNRLMGAIEYNEEHPRIIRFLRIATIRMACPDMAGERALLKALEEVVRFETVSVSRPITEIAFYGASDNKLIVIKKQ